MERQIDSGLLARTLKKVVPFAPHSTSLQILTNVRIQFSATSITFYATNLDAYIAEVIDVDGEGTGTLLIEAKRLFDVVRELPGGTVTLTVKDDKLFIIAGGFKCTIPGISIEYESDFPVPPVISGKAVRIANKKLDQLIRIGGYAVSIDQSRACLTGAYMQIGPKEAKVISTDGHRLAELTVACETAQETIKSIVPPGGVIKHLNASHPDDDTTIVLSEDEKWLSFQAGSTTTCLKAIAGPYPNYEKVIPSTYKHTATLSTSELREALRRSGVVANAKTQLTAFAFDSLIGLTLSVNNRDVGSTMEQCVDAQFEGEDGFRIGFNAKLFTELLAKVPSEKVLMQMTTQTGACVVLPFEFEGAADYRFLLMPLRILED